MFGSSLVVGRRRRRRRRNHLEPVSHLPGPRPTPTPSFSSQVKLSDRPFRLVRSKSSRALK